MDHCACFALIAVNFLENWTKLVSQAFSVGNPGQGRLTSRAPAFKSPYAPGHFS